MEIVEASGDSEEGVIREVIGEATKAMIEQSGYGTGEEDDCYDEASDSEDQPRDSGNEDGF